MNKNNCKPLVKAPLPSVKEFLNKLYYDIKRFIFCNRR